jgi:hypothetical protein
MRIAQRWRLVSFRGAAGGEWRGIVDVLAIRKDTSRPDHALLKSGDLFEFILVQMKGGTARRPAVAELGRLRAVSDRYHAKAVALFEWDKRRKPGDRCRFSTLGPNGKWNPSRCERIFG